MKSTEQFAHECPHPVKPGSIRSAYCRDGHYMGIRPIKLPNRFLAWPDDAVERILAQSKNTTESQQA